ncbi:MAG: type I restriction enzyme HsdR N-terminal domain-containing protein, partial [Chitinophagaceae bacterium]|nr:type I restriction enzyme HsdR N-terminal domain-containing protein [Chitinophagaceae bacterium]
MMSKEAKARIKINKLLEEAGWRFFDSTEGPANIILENNTKITEQRLNQMGENFEHTISGFIDYLLLDERGFPLAVVEAKKEEVNPLFAKEQARKYALAQNCRFVILSNGNQHYLWDLQRGSPNIITTFPSQGEITTFN